MAPLNRPRPIRWNKSRGLKILIFGVSGATIMVYPLGGYPPHGRSPVVKGWYPVRPKMNLAGEDPLFNGRDIRLKQSRDHVVFVLFQSVGACSCHQISEDVLPIITAVSYACTNGAWNSGGGWGGGSKTSKIHIFGPRDYHHWIGRGRFGGEIPTRGQIHEFLIFFKEN